MAGDSRIRLRDDLAGLKPYDPGSSVQEIVLSANENPFGMPEGVRAAALEAVAGSLSSATPTLWQTGCATTSRHGTA